MKNEYSENEPTYKRINKNNITYSSYYNKYNIKGNPNNLTYSKTFPAKLDRELKSRLETKQQSNYRKREAKQLNYKKVFIFFVILIIICYLLIFGISKSFRKNKNIPVSASTQTAVQDTTVNIAVIGDIMCHDSNIADSFTEKTNTYDFSKVFEDIKCYIQSADISIGNLETTFAGKKAGYSGYPSFNTPEQLAKNLVDLGLDVVSTANNHSLDKNYSGLVSTIDELDKVNLSHTGTYKSKEEQDTILIKNVNGINFAFLSFTYGTNGISVPDGKEYCINLINKELILDQLSKAKSLNPDVICVNMHWGEEYKLTQNSEQEELANFLFKNGVDIILGSHPHVLEPMGKRTVTLDDGSTKDGFIIYSLGNFMSGQVIENTKNSIILQLQLTKHSNGSITIDSYNYIPIYMYNSGNENGNKYKILDVNTCIKKYENGDKSISDDLYNTLKSVDKKINETLYINNSN